ncbi:hypothetical protein, partial [Actinomadura sp. RB99]|uniref:hypothetical protein n=1 Tax=Actinomadura sp. RB99 TaxID=2691577 RepID=UPI00168805F2
MTGGEGMAGQGKARGHGAAVGAMRSGDHLFLAYGSGAERHAVLSAYLRAGLAAGHALVHLADGEPARAVRDRLRALFAADAPFPDPGMPPTSRLEYMSVISTRFPRGSNPNGSGPNTSAWPS